MKTNVLCVIFTVFFCISATSAGAEIPEDAKRHMARGFATMEDAQSSADYVDAVTEFKKAVDYAPSWSDAWFNLGVAQESAEQYADAITSFRKYLALNPAAKDKAEVETRLYKLEYRAEKAVAAVKETQVPKLDGMWKVCDNPSCEIGPYGCGKIECAYCGGSTQFKLITNGSKFEMVNTGTVSAVPEYRGVINGDQITGEAIMDLSVDDRGVLNRIMKGTVSDNGRKITTEFQLVTWLDTQSFSASCVFIKN